MMVSETPTKITYIFSFQGAGERNEGKKKEEKGPQMINQLFLDDTHHLYKKMTQWRTK